MIYLKKNKLGSNDRINIKSPFYIDSEKKHIFGRYIEDSIEKYTCLQYNCNDIINKIEKRNDNEYVVFNVLSKDIEERLLKDIEPYEEFNGFNSDVSDFFKNIDKTIDKDKEYRIHMFGDIFQINYHYSSNKDIASIVDRCFDKMKPNLIKIGNLLYVCLEDFFKEDKDLCNYITSIKVKYNECVNENKNMSEEDLSNLISKEITEIAKLYYSKNKIEIDQINDPDLYGILTDEELHIEFLKKLVCIGCLNKNCKNITPNYILSIIDENDEIRIWTVNSIILNKIKNIYNEFGGDSKYGNIERFLIKHDVIYGPGDNVRLVPTKYTNITGTALVPNTEYCAANIVFDSLTFCNRFNEKLSKFFKLREFNLITEIKFSNFDISFLNMKEEEEYMLQQIEVENEFEGNLEFLEI